MRTQIAAHDSTTLRVLLSGKASDHRVEPRQCRRFGTPPT